MSEKKILRFKLKDLITHHMSGPSPDCEERNVADTSEWGLLKTTAVTWSGWNANAHKVPPASYWGNKRLEVRKGDVIVTKAGPRHRVGVVVYVDDTPPQLMVSGKMIGLRPDPSKTDGRVLAAALSSEKTQRYLNTKTTGMAESQLNFTNEFLLETEIELPPLETHPALRKMITALEAQINQTEALIEKYSQIKIGLMQDLFTRGLTAEGKLRPARSVAPELYQETPIGWLPNDWTVGGLLSVTDDYRQPILTGPFGADLGNADFVDEGVPLLRIGNVQNGYLTLDDLLFVTEGKAAQLSRYRVKSGDLLFARQGATTGRNCLANASVEGYLINYHIIRVALDHEKCAPVFIEAAFNERAIKKQIERDKGRGTREGINTQQLTKLCVPFPPLPEQRAIAALLENTNSVVQQERRSLEKLRHQKSGLMHDLLTGERPAKLDAPETSNV